MKIKKMRTFPLILMIFLLISLVSAEEMILEKAEPIVYKGLTIELTGIGFQGSAAIQIDSIKTRLLKNREQIIGDVNITLLDLTSETATVNIESNVECLINEDCNDSKPCTENICSSFRECIFQKSNGCELNDECVPTGSFAEFDGNLFYCNSEFDWANRKPKDARCINNYECLSNVCKENSCTKPKKQQGDEKMAPIWLVIIFGALFLLKGIFLVIKPKEMKNMLRELSYMKDNSLKIIGSIAVVIGAILVIWALT